MRSTHVLDLVTIGLFVIFMCYNVSKWFASRQTFIAVLGLSSVSAHFNVAHLLSFSTRRTLASKPLIQANSARLGFAGLPCFLNEPEKNKSLHVHEQNTHQKACMKKN